MFSNATRLEILLEAVPVALVGMSQKVRRILAGHEVDCLLGRSPGSIGFDRVPRGCQRHGSKLPASITLSRHSWGVLVDHDGA